MKAILIICVFLATCGAAVCTCDGNGCLRTFGASLMKLRLNNTDFPLYCPAVIENIYCLGRSLSNCSYEMVKKYLQAMRVYTQPPYSCGYIYDALDMMTKTETTSHSATQKPGCDRRGIDECANTLQVVLNRVSAKETRDDHFPQTCKAVSSFRECLNKSTVLPCHESILNEHKATILSYRNAPYHCGSSSSSVTKYRGTSLAIIITAILMGSWMT